MKDANIIIDSHAHFFPHRISDKIPGFNTQLRHTLKNAIHPISRLVHDYQPSIRHLPAPLRTLLDWGNGIGALAHLAVESGEEDCLSSMDEAGVHRAVIVSHEKLCPTQWVLDRAHANARFLAVIHIGSSQENPVKFLQHCLEQEAVGFKIYPMGQEKIEENPVYEEALQFLNEHRIPLFLHSGSLFSWPPLPQFSESLLENYERWISKFKRIPFILCHMNFHEPLKALDLAEKYDHLHLETSWQPAESIWEAVQRIGADRILFGSDWPFFGENMAIGKQRVLSLVETSLIEDDQARKILGKNAFELFLGAR